MAWWHKGLQPTVARACKNGTPRLPAWLHFKPVHEEWNSLRRGQELGVKLSTVQRTVSLQSWLLDSELGPDPRKLVSESRGQTVHLVEKLQKLKPLKTPNFRIRTNYPQMAWVTEAESGWSICRLRAETLSCWAEQAVAGPGPDGCEGHQEGHQPDALYSRELAQPKAHRGFPGPNKPKYPGQKYVTLPFGFLATGK